MDDFRISGTILKFQRRFQNFRDDKYFRDDFKNIRDISNFRDDFQGFSNTDACYDREPKGANKKIYEK